jgi:UDP-N-acetylmuramoyl-L-alanyl-D-glutamate--2,6-diaminopimelate ligase
MKLGELVKGLVVVRMSGDPSTEVTSIEHDSRRVRPGALFMAVRGLTNDGNTFIPDAVRKGASAVLTDEQSVAEHTAPVVYVPDSRKAMAIVADRFYGSPQNSLVMTAVTGTNGKTTTTYMVKSIFDTGGIGCGLIGTIRHIVGNETVQPVNTTPEAADIHAFLARMAAKGQSACIMEVSSHALVLSRVYGIRFRAVAFTNLTRDHLDFHGDLKSYLDAKGLLFSTLSGDSIAVINAEDPAAGYIMSVSRGGNILTFGFGEGNAIHPLSCEMSDRGSRVELSTPAGTVVFPLSLPGRYNIANAMAAAGIALACGFPREVIAEGLAALSSVPGRFQTVDEGQDFTVIVDYAHAPDALERVLAAAREITGGRLISVFGCGGDRDRGKRPMMGEISTRLADFTVVTSDNPRTEDPLAIIEEILEGIRDRSRCEVIPGREAAIRRAIESARPGDTVVIAGKGHEDYQIIGTKKIHFDDAETAHRLLRERR